MKYLILFVSPIIISSYLFAQCGNIERLIFPTPANAFVIESDQENNIILASSAGGAYTTMLRKSSDYTISNISRLFNGGIIRDMSIDAEGNIYVCGNFLYTFSIDDFPDVYEPGPTITSIFVAKLDSNLNTIWLKTSSGNAFSSANGSDRISSISVDNLGNCFIAGVYKSSFIFQGNDYSAPLSTHKSYVAKLNTSDGSLQWFHPQYCESSEPIPLVIADNNGGAYQSTFFYGDYYDLAGNHYQSNNHYNSLVFHFNSTGTYDWAVHLKGHNFIRALQLDTQNSLCVCGQMGELLQVQLQSVFNTGYHGLFIGKISINGISSGFDRIAATSMVTDIYMGAKSFRYMPDNTYYLSGQSTQEVNFNGLINPLGSQRETFVTKFSHLNNAIWSQGYGEISNTLLTGGFCTLGNCSVVSYGSLSNSNQLIFDDTTYNFSMGSSSDFLVEYNAFDGVILNGPIADTNGEWDPFGPNWTGVDDLENSTIQLYPNPNNGAFTISIAENAQTEITIFNSYNQVVWQGNPDNSGSIQTDLIAGSYFVTFKEGERFTVKRMIVI